MSCSATLKKLGYKMTPQRKVILDILHSDKSHLTAESIYNQVEAKIPGVNKSTVYRTLELLHDLGLVVRSEVGNEHIYHHSEDGHHHHLICSKCGKSIHCDEELLNQLGERLRKEYDFRADLHHHVIRGICEQCRARK